MNFPFEWSFDGAWRIAVKGSITFSALMLLTAGVREASGPEWLLPKEMTTASASQSDGWGDVDQDGVVSAFDAAQILRQASGIIVIPDPIIPITDVSGNGSITAYDAALVLQFVAGIIDCFPADPECRT